MVHQLLLVLVLGDEQLIRYTTGIDLVMGGHLHIVLNPPEVIEDCDPSPFCCESEKGLRIVKRLHELGCYCYPEGHPEYDPRCEPQKR